MLSRTIAPELPNGGHLRLRAPLFVLALCPTFLCPTFLCATLAGPASANDGIFVGVKSCSTSDCHGAAEEKLEGRTIHNEFTTWIDKDKHAQSYAHLVNKEGLKISKSLGIDAPQESDRCMNCHAIHEAFANPDRRGDEFEISNGNSCEDCHGAAQKWLVPHAKDKPEFEGWTRKQSLDAGMYDTLDVALRGEKCVHCHLQIDHELLEAGHPKMVFEMDLYEAIMPPHWRKPEEEFATTRAWAVGQILGLRESLEQLALRVEAGADEKWIQDAWTITRGYGFSAGPLAEWLDAATAKSVGDALEQVENGLSDAAKVRAAADSVQGPLSKLAQKAAAATYDAGVSKKLLDGVVSSGKAIPKAGYHAGSLVYLSLDSLYRPYRKAANPEKEKQGWIKKSLGRMQKVCDKEGSWDPKSFWIALKKFQENL